VASNNEHARCGQCDACRFVTAAQKLCGIQVGRPPLPGMINLWNFAVTKACQLTRSPEQYSALRDYVEFLDQDNGNYQNQCICGVIFHGPKRAVVCKGCERGQRKRQILQRLQDLYAGYFEGSSAYLMDSCLSDLRPAIQETYYRTVHHVFRQQLEAQRVVPFTMLNKEAINNVDELAQLFVDLGIEPFSTPE
jgi:hypothetical protein